MTTRYIIFSGAPTIQQCRDSWSWPTAEGDDTTGRGTWQTIAVPTSDQQRAGTGELPGPWEGSGVPTGEEGVKIEKRNTIFEDESDEEDEESEDDWTQADALAAGQEDETTMHDVTSFAPTAPSYSIIPGPSQRPTPSNPTPTPHHAEANSIDTSYSYTQDNQASFIDAPPNLPWSSLTLTPFHKLHTLATTESDSNPYGGPRASLLAAILDMASPKEVGNGKMVAEWELMDPNGTIVKFTMWDRVALDWPKGVRRGDVVYLSQISIQIKQASLHGSSSRDSTMQICYRTRRTSPEDFTYYFHAGHGELSTEAAKVLEIVRWWEKAFPTNEAGGAMRGVAKK